MSDGLTQFVLIIEYDGRRYCGFQLQLKDSTIQLELERALEKLTGEKTRVAASSRTDSGVHALGQVVSFRTSKELDAKTFLSGLNHYLPEDIAVRQAHRVSENFRVRSDAVSREYSYYILNSRIRSPLLGRYSHRVGDELDITAMNRACVLLIGEQDFISFASALGPETKTTMRQVYEAGVKKEAEMVVFNITANAFLTHQVRNTVGALISVGQGKMTVDDFGSIIKARKQGLAGPAAPACGLCLMKVNYKKPFNLE